MRNEIFDLCLEAFSKEENILKVVEECNELCVEVMHLPKKKDLSDLIGECADAIITIDKLSYMLDFEDELTKAKVVKLSELKYKAIKIINERNRDVD